MSIGSSLGKWPHMTRMNVFFQPLSFDIQALCLLFLLLSRFLSFTTAASHCQPTFQHKLTPLPQRPTPLNPNPIIAFLCSQHSNEYRQSQKHSPELNNVFLLLLKHANMLMFGKSIVPLFLCVCTGFMPLRQ